MASKFCVVATLSLGTLGPTATIKAYVKLNGVCPRMYITLILAKIESREWLLSFLIIFYQFL